MNEAEFQALQQRVRDLELYVDEFVQIVTQGFKVISDAAPREK